MQSILWTVLFSLLGVIGLAGWLTPLIDVRIRRWHPRHLSDTPPGSDAALPRLSILVPALNEEATVEAAMRSLLALDYPILEILAIDDRSTDQTGAILDRLAVEEPRLRVLHIRELPAGWLGKNHALHVGSLQATGEYLLFTDADVHFEQGALRRAVALAVEQDLDHLVLFPEVVLKGFWETLCVWLFGIILVFNYRPWRLSDPKSKAYLGIGAFNMVRASTYRKMGGHAALPMDVADDMKLGKKMKESGGRADSVQGDGYVSVRWVEGLWGLVEGLKKNMYGGFHFQPWRVLVGVFGLFCLFLWPVLGLFVGPAGTRLLCVVSLAMMVYAARIAPPKPGLSPLFGLAFPLGTLVIYYIIYRSILYTYRQGGIVWRGTHYALADLRKGIV